MTICFIVLACTVPFNQSFADDGVLDLTVEPFFTALQAGDLEGLKASVGGILYQDITAAFEQNKDYGTFLRQRYDKATFNPTVLQQDEFKMVVSVEVDFNGQGTSVFELLVQKDSTGNWRIVDQYSPAGKL